MSRWGLCRRCLVGLLHAPRAFAAGFGVGGGRGWGSRGADEPGSHKQWLSGTTFRRPHLKRPAVSQ